MVFVGVPVRRAMLGSSCQLALVTDRNACEVCMCRLTSVHVWLVSRALDQVSFSSHRSRDIHTWCLLPGRQVFLNQFLFPLGVTRALMVGCSAIGRLVWESSACFCFHVSLSVSSFMSLPTSIHWNGSESVGCVICRMSIGGLVRAFAFLSLSCMSTCAAALYCVLVLASCVPCSVEMCRLVDMDAD